MTFLPALQRLGRALMLPIAVLPVAGLLLRLGQPDLLDIPFIAASGAAVFGSIGVVFAVGIAIGLARENHGAAGLAALVAYLVTTEGAKALIQAPAEVTAQLPQQAHDLAIAAYRQAAANKFGMPVGILSGLIAGALYNRFHDIKLPDYLAFFAGRRFVPIVAGLAGVILAGVFGLGWPALERGMDEASRAVVASGEAGLFFYGALNRVLIVTGLHHILNNIAWFLIGDYGGATGDLNRFFAGDPHAGAFMTGFFPVMMFGLPAACLAMYHAAAPERRKAVAGLLLSMALTSFLTGVTEPIEFTFMFLAPLLYVVHAVLTGVAMVLMDLLGVKLGFTFSAGAIDYVLSYNLGTRPWMLLPVGAVFFALYYGLFRVVIVAFNLPTPGREAEPRAAIAPVGAGARGEAFVRALGGSANLQLVDACTTRLRLRLAEQQRVDEAALKALGARGLVRPDSATLQVVLGPIADQVASEIRAAMTAGAMSNSAEAGAPVLEDAQLASAIVAALGGAANVRTVQTCSTRIRLDVLNAERISMSALEALKLRGLVRPEQHILHVLIGPRASAVAASMAAL
ncbi:MAG TPA: N-acetylglucosamine-specific PTS transporter subunit IIBC [Vitreimonas sp.]|uniref:N-acetylglucosamine-specific PTS transporter subunit IIBC n=1 Tax=Vitreimonas sp. TaxID=3069702 RepID=UPI002D398594|nr:N-acetylglucosamine-specific PTS transporter subunit IIBC [Vitreimonas sp.]HYD86747.1 N-acetylglucosamine-specific PTS transporter subunit IIBC [Vitreimonas sp.]